MADDCTNRFHNHEEFLSKAMKRKPSPLPTQS
jgi:hypothetical protein